MKYYTCCRFCCQGISIRPLDRKFLRDRKHPKQQFENNSKSKTTAIKNVNGKTVVGESSQQNTKGTFCFTCHDYDHFDHHCPMRNLFIDKVHINDLDEHRIEWVY